MYPWDPPGREARIARLVHTSMRLEARPCVGGECDEYERCPRHDRIPEVADRLERLKERKRRPLVDANGIEREPGEVIPGVWRRR